MTPIFSIPDLKSSGLGEGHSDFLKMTEYQEFLSRPSRPWTGHTRAGQVVSAGAQGDERQPHLSHSPAFFCFSYFSGRVSRSCQGLTLNYDPPPYAFQVPGKPGTKPGLFVEMGIHNFLPGLVSIFNLPDLCLPRSWDYSCAPPCLDFFF
jgi:hypothetical protein